jgi:hypothetical protein
MIKENPFRFDVCPKNRASSTFCGDLTPAHLAALAIAVLLVA